MTDEKLLIRNGILYDGTGSDGIKKWNHLIGGALEKIEQARARGLWVTADFYPYTVLISDGLYGAGDNPHPRLYGAFPAFLRRMVLEKNLMTIGRVD